MRSRVSECFQPNSTHLTTATECAHECLKMMMGGQSHLAKLESVLNVLDIKTAEGHWAIDFGTGFLTAEHLQLT
jgi:hypothetical protein